MMRRFAGYMEMGVVYAIAAVLVGIVLGAAWPDLPMWFRWAGVAFACLLTARSVISFVNGPSGMADLGEDTDRDEPPQDHG